MNNTILMVWSGGHAGSSAASLGGMCLCLAPAKLQATDTRSAFPGRLNKQRFVNGCSWSFFSTDLS